MENHDHEKLKHHLKVNQLMYRDGDQNSLLYKACTLMMLSPYALSTSAELRWD
jgi:hypothetical protein